ncbi:hypothetical protein AGABI2DRAFT_72409 [Agaricus bisporus var. bisporus H97]|uniref:hypothetical protein n=1 Tax=Agaricus bisporus var. bisporus (strain H97 / ATCC MYA-4626 / FGSC 10389) TaxID=936046 RepID=UPI00029F52CD|nr:hypothetical protein AGABI2DRAFT_72409 [Agaricus bisporus var. bisporus H97]EKV45628.1 hypothetical protein AGABI2DRAFT_72409 [Agaricus bisporus var. bisporus H97]
MEDGIRLPCFNRAGHVAHAKRCMSALPASQTDIDASRLALAFYNIGILDLLGVMNDGDTISRQNGKDEWLEWLWAQQTQGKFGSGFRPSPFMLLHPPANKEEFSDYDTPHIIMTYTALLALSILRDDFAKLDRSGLIRLLRACQRDDGSFTTTPGGGESDLRTLYCAFAISAMLDDWSGVDVERAKSFVASCRTYEGGYGQDLFCEAQGGTTYIALASLYLAPSSSETDPLTPEEKRQTVKWLMSTQTSSGGFCGRTGKVGDSCYCFWCGASLKILKMDHLVETKTLASFLADSQFKFGGIAKCPGEHPDPYHTYLSIAALCMYPPSPLAADEKPDSWEFPELDPLLNARVDTAEWARKYISGKGHRT